MVAKVNFGALVSFYSCPLFFGSFFLFHLVLLILHVLLCVCRCVPVVFCIDNRFSPIVKKVIGERAISRKRKGKKVSEWKKKRKRKDTKEKQKRKGKKKEKKEKKKYTLQPPIPP